MSKHSVLMGATILWLAAAAAGPALAQDVTGQAPAAGAADVPQTDGATAPTDAGTGAPASAEAAPPSANEAVPAVPAAYLSGPSRMTDGTIEAWTVAPRKLLDDNPRGGAVMIAFVRSLAGSDNRTVTALIDLAKMSDVRDAQVSAIGIGLARATQEAQAAASGYAAYIQLSVASSGSTELIQAYERALGEQPTAALGLGGAGGGGGSPGSGSLTGGGESGPAGAINGDDVVENGAPTSGGSSGSSVSLSEDGGNGTNSSIGINGADGEDGIDGADGGAGNCDQDSSPAGCVL